MMDDVIALQRREFLKMTSVAPVGAMAATASVFADGGVANVTTDSLVVYRADDAASVAFAKAMEARGVQAFALGNDIVRQWRDELQELVVERGYRLTGRTGYADWFLLRGLAAEHRIFPQHEQQPTGHSFDWVI
jgi:hypothetical protein